MVHTWNPDCYGAIADSLLHGWLFSFKTYIIFYGLTNIFSAKDVRQVRWRKILTDSVRSSVFLTTNLIIFLWLTCQLRKILGFFTVPTLGFINGMISALLAILIENRRRRPLLALYLTNLVFLNNFSQALIWSICMVILKIGKGMIRQPATSIRRILRFRTLRLPLFYGFLALLFQVSRCGYSWCTNQVSPLSLCGAIGGLSLFFYPNISIAMYVFWKFVEGFFFSYYNNLMIPYGDIILYALSTGYVAWNAVIEPQALREGYWKFLAGLTGNKIEQLNRRLFDSFGYNSSKKFPHFIPKLDPRFTLLNGIWSTIHHD
uniref:TMEM135_C_rich domain-containing protein n=1 Tax=Loa loa TaxID=7209 RepID=A0A1I7VWB4_LOALO